MTHAIGLGWIECLTWLQRLSDCKRVGSIHRVIAEISEKTAVQLVCAGFGDDINRGPARTAEFSRIVATVDLKLLHGVLAQGETHSARVVIGFSAVHRDAIASAIT